MDIVRSCKGRYRIQNHRIPARSCRSIGRLHPKGSTYSMFGGVAGQLTLILICSPAFAVKLYQSSISAVASSAPVVALLPPTATACSRLLLGSGSVAQGELLPKR